NGDAVVMGAPGLNDWQGGFVTEDNFRNNYTIQPFQDDRRNWLLGYTVATAKLTQNNVNYVIAGSPRANLNGSVFIFMDKTDRLLAPPLIGEQFGSYFGSVICAADVNADGLDDVIVGAPHFWTNKTEEGRVYVYINRGSLRFERQTDVLNGSTSEMGRFGSAISDIGDINKDSFTDIAIGAPYENDGEGAVYIYNGYTAGLWSRYSQRIGGASIRPGIKAFGAALSKISINNGELFAVGAYESDTVVVLRSNPVVALETMMQVRPDLITARESEVSLKVCFKYTGDAATLPTSLAIKYRLEVDTSTPRGSVRALVIPNSVPDISRAFVIQRDEFVCDDEIRVYAPYKDIWRDVVVEARYSLDESTCTGTSCPVLETFNGKNPGAITPNGLLKKTIKYDKQCGPDNVCDTRLSLQVRPVSNSDHIVMGKDTHLGVEVSLGNENENAYNVIIDVTVYGNSSKKMRTYGLRGDPLVDCDQLVYETPDVNLTLPTHRCYVRKPYPLEQDQSIAFLIQFPLDDVTLREFRATFAVRTEEHTTAQATATLRLAVKSEYGLRIDGTSNPEQVTLGVQQETDTWTEVEHRYSVKNLGPSPLEHAEFLAYVPTIIHRNDPLITNISVWLWSYKFDPPKKERCSETVIDAKVPASDSAGGYAISVDCSSFPCKRFSCFVTSFTRDESLLVSVNMSVSKQILTRLQARDTVRLASRVSIPEVNFGKSLDKEVETMFHKSTNSMERKKIAIPIWLIIVSVVSAFLVLLVIVAILIKVGFFKRHKKEEIRRLKSTRRTSSPFKDTVRNTASNHEANGASDNTRILSSIEDTNNSNEHEHAHDNPVASAHVIDDVNGDYKYPEKRDNFLNELQRATNKKGDYMG
ncbi:hypothetical protein DPMN_063351, partial [Dreissena polymorpha]